MDLKILRFYVQKHITPCTIVITSLLVRDKPLGSPASVKGVYWFHTHVSSIVLWAPRAAEDAGSQHDDVIKWKHFPRKLAICAGNSPVPGEFPTQRPVTRSFDVYFDLRPNIRLSKHSWGWWFETLSSPLWRHRNGPKPPHGHNIRVDTTYQHCFR